MRNDMTNIPKANETVPHALQEKWDARHDSSAAEIMTEFGLVLPRDRELVRQLAFMRVAQGLRR
jgi:hypothetical protein